MARRPAPANQWAVEYTHKKTGTRLLDVCQSEDGAVAYGDMIIASGHRDVELVEVRPRPGGKFVKI